MLRYALLGFVAWMIAAVNIAAAQVVHLPTFQFFGINTTVSVPDRGAAYLGGVSRSSSGRTGRGLPLVSRMPFAGRPFGNRAAAVSSQASGVSVSAYIHDFESMDQQLLRQSQPHASREQPARPADIAGRTSIRELERQHSAHEAIRNATAQAQARADYERATTLVKQGKAGAAKVYLQRAAKQADAALRAKIAKTAQQLDTRAPIAQTALPD
jgi:hypothetical protein